MSGLGAQLVRLRCRLNLFHRWRTRSDEEGGRYQQCLDCNKDRGVPTVTPPM